MDGEQKPFACNMDSCGMSFTNEDHLNVHRKKHDMVLNFGSAKGVLFLADQTPTPTRLIRNCDEVGLFDDMAVNPFEETFRRAVESKDDNMMDHTRNSLNPLSLTGDETLHTPHVMPYFSVDRHTLAPIASKSAADVLDDEFADKCDKLSNSDADMLLYLSKSDNNISIDEDAAGKISDTDHNATEINHQSQVITGTHVVSQSPSTFTRASVIYVPQVSVQPVSGVIYEIAPKKFKPKSQNNTSLMGHQQKRHHESTSQNLPKIYPKTDKETAANSTRNFVKEKLKEALLKIRGSSLELAAIVNEHPASGASRTISTVNDDQISARTKNQTKTAGKTNPPGSASVVQPQRSTTNSDGKSKHLVQNDRLYEKNRAAAAAKRYRIKFKNEHNNLKRKNTQLETENERLRSELRAVKAILLSHQDCSITRAMAMGNVYSLAHTNDPAKEMSNEQSTIKLAKPSLHTADPPVFVILSKDGESSCN